MTDPNLAEQAEREIAEEQKLAIGCVYLYRLDGTQFMRRTDPAWEGWVRDRCSLLKLRKAAEGYLKSREVRYSDIDGAQMPSWQEPQASEIRAAESSLRSALEGR